MTNNTGSTPMVSIEWGKKSKQFDLAEIDLIKAAIEDASSWPTGFSCREVSTLDLLEKLSLLTDLIDETYINDTYVESAPNLEGVSVYIPSRGEEGVRIVSSGSTSWLPGGPCLMEQHEKILCYENLYWVEAYGDSDRRKIVVGRFNDEKDAIRFSVKASLYFYIDDHGNVKSELDDGPQEQ